jgi:hypothetical protein
MAGRFVDPACAGAYRSAACLLNHRRPARLSPQFRGLRSKTSRQPPASHSALSGPGRSRRPLPPPQTFVHLASSPSMNTDGPPCQPTPHRTHCQTCAVGSPGSTHRPAPDLPRIASHHDIATFEIPQSTQHEKPADRKTVMACTQVLREPTSVALRKRRNSGGDRHG